MNNKHKIILYLDNNLPEKEKQDFEKELSGSPELLAEFNRIKNSLQEIKRFSGAELNQDYLNSIIPEFWEKRGHAAWSRKIFSPALVKFIPAAAVILFGLTLILLDYNGDELTGIGDLTEPEIVSIAGDYSIFENTASFTDEMNSVFSDRIDSLFSSELFENIDEANLMERVEYSTLVAALSDAEAETIYEQIINKNLVSGKP